MSSKVEKPWDTENYWETRFKEQNTPWDLGEASPTLIALEKVSKLPANSSILFPGCGRGQDPLYFAELGYKVSAVDWSAIAMGDLRVLAKRKTLPMEILKSSFWEVPDSWDGTFDAIAEHTFFVAIDPLERSRYVEKTSELLTKKGVLLASFFVIPEQKQDSEGWKSLNSSGEGPPFSCTEKEIRKLFSSLYHIEILEPSPSPRPDPIGKWEWWALFRKK